MPTAAVPLTPNSSTLDAMTTAAATIGTIRLLLLIRCNIHYHGMTAMRTDDGLLADGRRLTVVKWQIVCGRCLRIGCFLGSRRCEREACWQLVSKELGDGYSGGLGNLAEGLHRQIAVYGALRALGFMPISRDTSRSCIPCRSITSLIFIRWSFIFVVLYLFPLRRYNKRAIFANIFATFCQKRHIFCAFQPFSLPNQPLFSPKLAFSCFLFAFCAIFAVMLKAKGLEMLKHMAKPLKIGKIIAYFQLSATFAHFCLCRPPPLTC